MSNKHQIAVDMIDSRLDELSRKSSPCLHSETLIAIEMAYALGAISFDEHTHYTRCRARIVQQDHEELMTRMLRCA